MGPLAWPISEMVPCIPMAAPSVFNSDTSATKAEVDDVTTASPNPKPAASTNRSGSDCVYGMSNERCRANQKAGDDQRLAADAVRRAPHRRLRQKGR